MFKDDVLIFIITLFCVTKKSRRLTSLHGLQARLHALFSVHEKIILGF